jgi:hypothetical protein
VFQASGRTWGPGHNCFTTSPDGGEDWIVFHAKLETKPNWKRAIHVQRFTWDESGAPVFGRAIDPGVAIMRPSGESVGSERTIEVALGRAALTAAVGEQPIVSEVRVVQN